MANTNLHLWRTTLVPRASPDASWLALLLKPYEILPKKWLLCIALKTCQWGILILSWYKCASEWDKPGVYLKGKVSPSCWMQMNDSGKCMFWRLGSSWCQDKYAIAYYHWCKIFRFVRPIQRHLRPPVWDVFYNSHCLENSIKSLT